MAIRLDRPVLPLAGKVVFSHRYNRVTPKRKNFIDCCRVMMRDSIEQIHIILFNLLTTVFRACCPVCDQYTVIRVKTSDPGCVMVVPVLVVCGNNLFDLLFGVLIDTLSGC
jgi:hypothetical protein